MCVDVHDYVREALYVDRKGNDRAIITSCL